MQESTRGDDVSDAVPGGFGSEALPVRMINELVYCPRLFFLMHVEGRWADNEFTEEGRHVHRRVDRLDHVLPDAVGAAAASGTEGSPPAGAGQAEEEGDRKPDISRSVPLSSVTLGITAKLDLVSTADDEAVPVETKRGRVPNNPERSWEPERVQLMLQGLLLREHGYRCDHGVLYFAGSRTRVDVPFTAALEARAREAIAEARRIAAGREFPPPLDESPKCHGCSLNSICLPDETAVLRRGRDPGVPQPASAAAPGVDDDAEADDSAENDRAEYDAPANRGSANEALADQEKAAGADAHHEHPAPPGHRAPRRLHPARDVAAPVYVQEQGATIGKSREVLIVRKQGAEIGRIRLKDTSQVVVCGNVQVTAQAIRMLGDASIPLLHVSTGHWFSAVTHGLGLRNAYDRAAQFATAGDPARCLVLAREFVLAKVRNQRTMLRRNARPASGESLEQLRWMLKKIPLARSPEELLGLEGTAARAYFQSFSALLQPRDLSTEWDFAGRNRRPPKDPINALLSFGYAMLSKECTVAALAEGLDPWWGFFHKPRHGRPALALDLMEEFRPLVADSAVITAINTGMVAQRDFVQTAAGCAMQPGARKGMIRAFEARLDQLVTHPIFDYRCSWRSIIRLQARLLSRYLRGDVPAYVGMTTR